MAAVTAGEPESDRSVSLRPLGQVGLRRELQTASSCFHRGLISCVQPIIVVAEVAGWGHWLHYCDSGSYAADTRGREWLHKGLFLPVTLGRVYRLCCRSVYAPSLLIFNPSQEGRNLPICNAANIRALFSVGQRSIRSNSEVIK